MAEEETQNRAELVYTARVDKPSFAVAREEVRRENEQSAREARQAPVSSASGISDAEREELRRVRAERTAVINERNAQRQRELNQDRVVSEEEFRIASRLNTQKNRIDEQEILSKKRVRDQVIKFAAEKAAAEEAAYKSGAGINTLFPGTGAANFNLTGGYKSSLLARADSEELAAFRSSIGGAGAGGRGGGAGGPLGGGYNRFAQRRAIAESGYVLGAPEVGQLGSLVAYGPQFAAAALAIGAVAISLKAVEEAAKDRDQLISFAASISVVGVSFNEAKGYADSFHNSLLGSREEAEKLAVTFSKLKVEGIVKPEDLEKINTIATARGQTPDQVSSILKSLGKGSTDVFEEQTGRKAEIVFAERAQQLGTIPKLLTEQQKAQALVNSYLSQANDLTQIAAIRNADYAHSFEALKTKGLDNLSTLGSGLLSFANSNADKTLEKILLYTAKGSSLATTLIDTGVNYLFKRGTAEQANLENQLSQAGGGKIGEQSEKDVNQVAQIEGVRAAQEKVFLGLESKSVGGVRQLRALINEYDEFKTSLIGLSEEAKTALADIDEKYVKKLDASFSEAEKSVASASKKIIDSFDELAALHLTETDNPYVKLFSEGATSLAHFKDQFPLLSDEAVASFDKMKQAQIESAIYQNRVKDNLTATRLEFEAAQLAKPFIELTGEMKRTLSVFESELKTLSGPANLFAARQIESGGAARLPFLPGPLQGLAGQQLQGLESLTRKYAGESGRGGEEIQHLLNQQFIKLYEGLSPQDKLSVFRQGGARFEFANAYRGEERYGRQQLDLTIQRAEASRSVVDEAKTELKELQRLSTTRGADPNVTRSQFLAITGSIPREELTPDLIKGRTAALKEQAAFERAREKQASDAIVETQKWQAQILKQLDELSGALKSRNESVLITVQDATDKAQVATLGPGYTPDSSKVQPSASELARSIQGLN